MPIIDTHIHLFDTERPKGVPWPDKTDVALYRPALPERYRKMTEPLGVAGAIVIEASPWPEDNDWVLDIAANNPLIVGMVGDLDPGTPGFGKQLERYHENPLFLGIRYGNLWGRDLGKAIEKQEFVNGLRLLSQAGLSLDTANQDANLIAAALRVTDLVPELRVVIDHLPQLDPAVTRRIHSQLRQLAERPRVYVKLSSVFRRIDGSVPRDLGVYRATLDDLFGLFGEDRVLYGSDWPNSDHWRPYEDVLSLVQEYFSARSSAARAKFFWRNSIEAYRWKKRSAGQPTV